MNITQKSLPDHVFFMRPDIGKKLHRHPVYWKKLHNRELFRYGERNVERQVWLNENDEECVIRNGFVFLLEDYENMFGKPEYELGCDAWHERCLDEYCPNCKKVDCEFKKHCEELRAYKADKLLQSISENILCIERRLRQNPNLCRGAIEW